VAGEAMSVEIEDGERWAGELRVLHTRLSPYFERSEPRQRAINYLRGLLSDVPRKNGWQLAEQAGERTPDGMQRLLNTSVWQVEGVRDELVAYVNEQLGSPNSVLVVDETGFVKKGTKSVGVKRQYSGTAGRIENCQIGVFLAYATDAGHTLVDREVYLPKEWAEDRERRAEAGVPERVVFQTKPPLARQLLERAFAAGLPCAWVTGDTIYGGDRAFRFWLEQRRQPFVLAVPKTEPLWVAFQQLEAQPLAAAVPADGWRRLSAGDGRLAGAVGAPQPHGSQ
jgi:SRSO17 transposase